MNLRQAVRTFLAVLAGIAALAFSAAAVAADQPADREILVMLNLPAPHYRPSGSYGGSYGDVQTSEARRRIAMGIARANRLELVSSWPMPLLAVDCYVMRVPEGMDVAEAVARVSRASQVKWSQPLHLYSTKGNPGGDPLVRATPAATSWHILDLHRFVTGRGVNVAVIDSKVDVSHPDLKGQFSADRDFVGGTPARAEQHGTAIAGIIGAKQDNGVGIAGVAPGSRMMALRACWQQGTGRGAATTCDTLSLAKALQFAVEHDASVINLSLSGPSDLLLQRLINIAIARHRTVVAAYDPNLPAGGFPASQPGVIAVTDDSMGKIPSALYGAPGEDVPTTEPGGKWDLVTGSSYAAAHVSGLAALLREERGNSPPSAFVRSASGAVDACASLLRVTPACDCRCASLRKAAEDRR